MPIFEYKCRSCKNEFEKLVFSGDEVVCPKCNGPVDKLMSCCSFKSAAGDFKTSGTGKSGCSGCTATSCSTCH
jgi:putative FmdB family regulatory protein